MAVVKKLFWQLGTHFLVAVVVVERWSLYRCLIKGDNVWTVCLDQKSGCCRKVAVVERWLPVKVQLYQAKVLFKRFYLNGNTILDCIHRLTKCLCIT